MDLRRQEEERGYKPSPSLSPAAPPQSPHPIKESTFSKPLLPLNSSLVQRGERGEARNGGGGYALAPSPFNSAPHRLHAMAGRSGGVNIGVSGGLKSPASATSSSSNSMQADMTWHYRECQRNHAAGIGGHVVDGCCEFMPSDDATLKCAACGCHRSFHRKVCSPNPSSSMPAYSPNGLVVHRSSPPQLLPPPLLSPPPIPPPSQTPQTTTDQSSSEEMNVGTLQQSQAVSASPTKKRFRTKFTPEQKEKMFKFAESLSWRFQKPDDAAINEFCAEAGVNRHVLKVWMHNNKYTYKKQEQYQPSPAQQQMPQEGPQQLQDHQEIP